MADQATIKTLGKFVGQTVTMNGWVYNSRSSGKIGFLMFRDGTGIVQCIVGKSDVGDEMFDYFKTATQESSISVTGEVKEEPRAPGGYEMHLSDLVIHQIAVDYPISTKEHGTDFLMNHRHLWIRSKRQHAILIIRHHIIKACRDFFDENGFVLVDSPIITPNAVEGSTTLFGLEYFDRRAFLTQSGQLYSEASIGSFGKVYCFGPTFRAEKSKTRRHLTEFWMVEPEMAYCDLDQNMEVAEQQIIFMVERVLENCQEELKVLERDVSKLESVQGPFPRVSYNECVEILHKNGVDFEWGGDFGGGDETIISEKYDRPIMVHRFPAAIKAFYMKKDADDPRLALGMDVLAPEGYGEIIGGGQREENLDVVLKGIEEEGLDPTPYNWYLDLRKYGTVPHSGYGMGIERAVAWICKLPHVRETIPFPRMLNRLEP